ncbi:photosystem II reaction center PsbP [Synechococcus sp. B60.1]|uniref:photosystem II reaction center PsbP n=1 Tax=unclassified Synechococcus TaxID=2626047 RepID=UPI0039C1C9AF
MSAARGGHFAQLGQRLSGVLLLLCVCLSLLTSACSAGSNLRAYRDPGGAFAFAYPNGMVAVNLGPGKGPAVLLRDLVYETENVSLMIAPFDKGETIADLGGPDEVGQLVAEKIIAPAGSGRSTQLLAAEAFERQGQPYYLFEYQTDLGSQLRHEIVTVTVRHHRLYTLTASTRESRWPQVQAAFRNVGRSLNVS